MKGPIEVKGTTYNLNMPAMAASWEEFDLAALSTYVTNAFGKNTKEITSIEQVKDLKKRLAEWKKDGGSGQLTAKELTDKPYFQGKLAGAAPANTDLVNKKSGLPE